MADFLLVAQPPGNAVVPTFDRVITPAGDWATVSGTPLLAQNVLLFLCTPVGSDPTNPTFGSTLPGQIGQGYTTPAVYQSALSSCVSYFRAVQAAQPQIPADEQLAGIDTVDTFLDATTLGLVHLTFVVHAASGNSQTVVL